MTQHKQFKALVRARMSKTGESYVTARRQLIASLPTPEAATLTAGVHPETAAMASALRRLGLTHPADNEPIDESFILGIGGGLGMGYLLWEFDNGARRVVTTGFRNQWQYPQKWFAKVGERLGIAFEISETGGAKRAQQQLDAALAGGRPAVVGISAADLGYWHLPEDQSGWMGYPIVVVGSAGDDRFFVDDRTIGTLTIDSDTLGEARGRISSYKNRLVSFGPTDGTPSDGTMTAAIRAGLLDQVDHLAATSTSFGLPAIKKWARLMVDPKNAKGWPSVFADGRALLGCLVSVVEAIDEVGLLGGDLRSLYADHLDRVAPLVGVELGDAADAYRLAAERWDRTAEVALGVAPVDAIVTLDRARRTAVRNGDAGASRAKTAADQSSALLAEDDTGLDSAGQDALFRELSDALTDVHAAEVIAHRTLSEICADGL